MITIASWNVNGVRAASQKGLLEWLQTYSPDILCLQETKAHKDQLEEHVLNPEGYLSYWASAKRRGYSGVAVYSKIKPESVDTMGLDRFDDEGRALFVHYPHFTLINAYFPNSQAAGARLDYKLDFCNSMLRKCNALRKSGHNLVLCGDYNIAHTEIDLANPKSNEKNPGYLPEERAWMTTFLSKGYVDTFRMFTKEGGHYSWWSYRFKAREKNIGWRIDYHCVNKEFEGAVERAEILNNILGSDHCPVMVSLRV